AAQALGMNKVVSEDALRRALERIDETASAAWLRPSLMHSVREALDRPWVLDIDASIKPLYGRQEGAEIGYNPSKPIRPSHVLHTFLVANLRLVLDVQVSSGKQHTSGHAKTALGRLLDELGEEHQLAVRRGRRTVVPAHVHAPAQRVHHLCRPVVDTAPSHRHRLASCFTHRVSVPRQRKSVATLEIPAITERQLPDLG
ncbi:MAG: hypothetical protein ACKOD9_01360, partial [Rubrivivax sp.]